MTIGYDIVTSFFIFPVDTRGICARYREEYRRVRVRILFFGRILPSLASLIVCVSALGAASAREVAVIVLIGAPDLPVRVFVISIPVVSIPTAPVIA